MKLKKLKPTFRMKISQVLSSTGVFKEKVTVTRTYFFGLWKTTETL